MRVAVLATALLASLAFAGSAFASFVPSLKVANTATGVSISVSVANADAPTSRVAIYVPQGYTLNPPTLGSKLGDVTATASAADLGGAVLPLTGELDAISESALSPTAKAGEAACLQGGTPAAIWDMHLTAAGQALDIPMYVVQTTGVEQTAGVAKIITCLPPPDVPASNPERATFGAKLLTATFNTSALTATGATDGARWTSLWTPYTPGAGTPNAAGSIETQSVIHTAAAKIVVKKKKLVSTKKVKGKLVKVVRTQVHWSVSATSGGTAATGAIFVTTKNGKSIGGASGSFVLLKGQKATLATTVTIPDQSLGAAGCTPSPIFQGLPCIGATVAGGSAKATAKVVAYKA